MLVDSQHRQILRVIADANTRPALGTFISGAAIGLCPQLFYKSGFDSIANLQELFRGLCCRFHIILPACSKLITRTQTCAHRYIFAIFYIQNCTMFRDIIVEFDESDIFLIFVREQSCHVCRNVESISIKRNCSSRHQVNIGKCFVNSSFVRDENI